jgi:hypothetical protein
MLESLRPVKFTWPTAADSDALRKRLARQGAWGNIKPMPGRVNIPSFSRYLYRFRNLVECFFKHFRAVATWPAAGFVDGQLS